MAKSHSDNLLVYVKADADLKLKDKEQHITRLRDFVGQSAEQCKQLQNYVQNAHHSFAELQSRHETEKLELKSEYSARRNSDLERIQRAHAGEI